MYRNLCFLISLHFILTFNVQADMQLIQQDDSVSIHIDGKAFATYVYKDDQIPRPYFHSIHTLSGIQVTRHHPPIKGKEPMDHATYHPGLWLTFGDIRGHDYWRNKAETRHIRFLQSPQFMDDKGIFTVLNHYMNGDEPVCEERCSYQIIPDSSGILLCWNSEFYSAEHDFYFGDQEEMGLGVRVAASIMAENGGTILNHSGDENEKEVWGKQSRWCAYYSKDTGDGQVGILLMPSPDNFRDSWFHARDYGLLTANPFGRKAFTDGPESKVAVKSGEKFKLRFGVYIFHVDKVSPGFLNEKYKDYVSRMR